MKVAGSNQAELACRTWREILDASFRVLASRGYARSSRQAVAKAARVAKPTLYYHYGKKADPFRVVADRSENQLLELILKIKAGGTNVLANWWKSPRQSSDLPATTWRPWGWPLRCGRGPGNMGLCTRTALAKHTLILVSSEGSRNMG
jgi:AcrR family transcriptional regulator